MGILRLELELERKIIASHMIGPIFNINIPVFLRDDAEHIDPIDLTSKS